MCTETQRHTQYTVVYTLTECLSCVHSQHLHFTDVHSCISFTPTDTHTLLHTHSLPLVHTLTVVTRVLNCPYLQIGNQYTRGVSGGEKKRTGIGMELVTSPNILCLDEPTTGLDACAAISVMQLLKE